jgi:hypothetical protein
LVYQNKRHKSNLLAKIDAFDRKAETSFLSPQEEELRHHLKGQFNKLLRERRYIGSNDQNNKVVATG